MNDVVSTTPSPYTFGCHYAKILISAAISQSDGTSLPGQLISVIQNTDIQVLHYVMTSMLQLFNANNASRQFLASSLQSVLHNFRTAKSFGAVVTDFFNELTQFPTDFLKAISLEAAFYLTLFGCYSKFDSACRQFLEDVVLPELPEPPDRELLYELCSLHIPFPNFMDLESPDLRLLSSKANNGVTFQCPSLAPTLLSVLLESPPSLFGSSDSLHGLFKFFPNFDHTRAATFLLAIVSPGSSFQTFLQSIEPDLRPGYFLMYRDVLLDYGIDLVQMVTGLDQPGFGPLPLDSAVLLFSILSCIFEKQLLPSSSFTREWRNSGLQLSLMNALVTIHLPNLDFSKGGSLINIHQLEIPSNSFASTNNCWLSLEFAERVVVLAKDDQSALTTLVRPLQQKWPSLILAIFGQVNMPKTPALMAIAIDALTKVMQSNTNQKTLATLWKACSLFLKQVIVAFYTKQPGRIDLIYEAASGHLLSLYEVENVPFVVDLACQANAESHTPFAEFLNAYVSRYQSEVIPKIAEYLKNKVTETMTSSAGIVSDLVLNSFFQFFADHFESFPFEVRASVQQNYITCLSARPKLARFTFDLKYAPAKLREIRQTASKNYAALLADEISVEDFCDQLKRHRSYDPKLYSCMIYFLIREFNHLDKHSVSALEKLADVVGGIFVNGLFRNDVKAQVLMFVHQALMSQEPTVRSHFSIRILNLMTPRLTDENHFVSRIVHESALKVLDSQLFEKVQRLLQEPAKSSVAKALVIHPLLRRFENIQSPLPRVCKAVQLVQKEFSTIVQFLSNYSQYSDWFALHIVKTIQEQPRLAKCYVKQINESKGFWKLVFQAAVSQVYGIIQSPSIGIYDGALLRRRLLILGRLIGELTVAVDRPLFSRFLDVKRLLLYAFAQGKLYSVVPFVGSVFLLGSANYGPGNPFIASILQILAVILKTNSIKLSIKQHILALFSKMGITLSMFASVPEELPEKIHNNFDFLLPPFSLSHIAPHSDIDRIAMFDDKAFAAFGNAHLVIPDLPTGLKIPKVKDALRQRLLGLLLKYLSTEGDKMSRIAASTASELILRDFMAATEIEQMVENAVILTKKLVAGLTLFTGPAKIAQPFATGLKSVNDSLDTEYVDLLAQKNYEWFVQLLRDVVEVRAMKLVHQVIDKSEELRSNLVAKRARLLTGFLQNPKQCLSSQQLQIYCDLNDLCLSQQPFPILDVQPQDKEGRNDEEFETYLLRVQKQVPIDYPRPSEAFDDPTLALLERCPAFADRPITRSDFVES
jgi:CCR4-NOT transcription complex subunit 1